MNRDSALDWAQQVLREAVNKNSFGKITFHFQNGVIANAQREVTIKPGIDTSGKKE